MVSNTLLALASLTSMYWGMHNEGDAQRINIDHFTSGYVMGVKGEDIRVPAPAMNPSKVIVAVLDTGVDSTNPALKGLIAPNGYNFVNNNKDTTDTHGHGTHLSGIIATQATQNAMILPVKVVQTGPNAPITPEEMEPGAGTALTENVAKGIVYAVNNGAKVINLSLAWPMSIRSKTVDDAMALAEQNNVLVVASAANDGTSTNLYPCVYNNVICVGAHGPDGAFTYFSNFGSMVDILAPGIAILSTWPMNKAPVTFAGQIGYEFRNGTSMSAPFVSGAAAELISRGYSASETKSRLLLGSRPTQTTSLYTTVVVGTFSPDKKKETKFARFGNLDITQALAVSPQSLILPVRKARNEVRWNGLDTNVTSQVQWKNNWKDAKNVTITIGDQVFNEGSIVEGQTFVTPVNLAMSDATESTFDRSAKIEADEADGTHSVRNIPISFTVSHYISLGTLPVSATTYVFQTIHPSDYSSIRSVVNVDHSSDRELYLVRNNEMVLTRKGAEIGRATFGNVTEDQILNLYRIDENNYSLISKFQAKGDARQSVLIKSLDSKLQLINEVKLGTDITVLPENFVWKKSTAGNSLLWISIGLTPTMEKPAYDPWNPKYTDSRMSRIYYTIGNDLHSIKLADDELPIQVLPTGDVLIAKGDSYFATYSVLSVDLTQTQKVTKRTELSLLGYRMLIGLDGTNSVLPLKGSVSNAVLMVGASSPGNLRGTTIDAVSDSAIGDAVLKRESTLDSLVQVSGAFSDLDQQYFFVQTHYDMKFYRSNSNNSQSTSLNRYSYIPSMIFSRNFFPTVAKDKNGNGIPAVYIPATIANANVSDLILGNPKTGEVQKPALFHFETAPECLAMGNLIPATETDVSKQVFICGNEVVLVPLVVY